MPLPLSATHGDSLLPFTVWQRIPTATSQALTTSGQSRLLSAKTMERARDLNSSRSLSYTSRCAVIRTCVLAKEQTSEGAKACCSAAQKCINQVARAARQTMVLRFPREPWPAVASEG